MSRRGGGRGGGSEPRRDQPSPAAPRGADAGGRGGGRGRGRGRGAPVPTSASSSDVRSGPVPTPVVSSPAVRSGSVPTPVVSSPAARSGPVPAPVAPPATPAAVTTVESVSAGVETMAIQPRASPATVVVATPSSSRALKPPSRPGYGTVGVKCMVRANHFLVQIAETELCHYDVAITPEVTSKKVNRDVMTRLVNSFSASHLGGKKAAYDGRKSLYTAGELPFTSKDFVIKLDEKDGQKGSSSDSKRKDRDFRVVVKFASKPDIHLLKQYLQGRHGDVPHDIIQVLDVVLRDYPSQNYTVVGRSFFHPSLIKDGKGELGNGIEYWKGYYQSLRPTQMGLSLNIDVSARGFYEALPVLDFIRKYLNVRGDMSRPMSDQDRLKVRKVLKGLRVESYHLSHKKTYKVTGISVEPISKLMFSLDDSGRQISVAKYFMERYKIPVKYGFLPAIQAGSATKPVSLPMEICSVVGGQRYTKKLNENQIRNLLRATCQRPPIREESIKTVVGNNKYNSHDVVKQFGINVKAEMTMVEARVLPPPTILYHGSGRDSAENPQMGQWNMINKKMVNPGKVNFWGCVNFSGWWDNESANYFCKALIDMCSSRGMDFDQQPVIPVCTELPTNIPKTLSRIHNETSDKIHKKTGQVGRSLQLLIIILPDASGTYGKIKRVCETELGIVTQCFQPKKAEKGGKQYLENLSLKINVKVGGKNSILNDVRRTLPVVSEMPTIIFGADVTHPSPGEDSSPSIAAVVASMDWPEVTKYRGLVSAQGHRVEMIQDLYKSVTTPKGVTHGGMIREHLLAFHRSTNRKPDRIVFYRDGVSEGQFNQVLLDEMDAIRKGCASLQADYQPRVTFVVVQKRHHTRLFPTDRNTDRSGNIRPGTVVDTKICHPSEFDFYLNSHAGIQGTSRPTHYHVLYDENNFSADQMQVLTNSLCYTYARCTRSVSIVPPAYYAHLAAFRARYYIEGDFSDAESSMSGGGGAGVSRVFQPLPAIKDNVKEVMFYC